MTERARARKLDVMRTLPSVLLSLALVAGCGDDGDPADAGPPGTLDAGPGGVDAGPGGGADAGPGGADAGPGGGGDGGFTCGSTVMNFPTFDRSCASASDCVALRRPTDCCGNGVVTGVAATDREAFEAAVAACLATLAECDCPAGPPVADDGTTGTFGGEPSVECAGGVCTTTFPEG